MKPRSRNGFTLTELLVVTAILMSLFGLVLSGARTSGRSDGDIRRGAQQFASLLLASQSLSLGSPTGAAVIVDPEPSEIETDGKRHEVEWLSETVAQARRFPFIEGDVLQGMPPTQDELNRAIDLAQLKEKDPNQLEFVVSLQPTNDDEAALLHGYKIRFFERADNDVEPDTDSPVSEWFKLEPSQDLAGNIKLKVKLRVENGQSLQNTLWPAKPASGLLRFQVARYPIPAGLSQTLPEGVAIDLRYSGYDNLAMSDWHALANKAPLATDGKRDRAVKPLGAIAVGFDPVGTVDSLMQNVLPEAGESRTVQPLTPSEQIYFLITLRDEIEDPTVNTLASDRAMWVVVQPQTGRVTIAENVPQTSTDVAALMAARAKGRKGFGIGG
jgi:prepilin-type N-terminal cleavage/methylation domain-containing protein